jgi:plastocyanin
MFAFRNAVAAALSLAAAASVPAAANPNVTVTPAVVIDLYSYGYRPNPIQLAAGRPVTLTFVNRAGKGHDFTAPGFFRAARILSGKVANGEVDLAGRQSASVTLIPAAGTYRVHCGRPFHKLLGMSGTIVVR